MRVQRFVPISLVVMLMFCAFPMSASARADASHRDQIWGSLSSHEMKTDSTNVFDKEITVVVREVHGNRRSRIVGFSTVHNGRYAVDMGRMPAGKYEVSVDPGASDYEGGAHMVQYPGAGHSVELNWGISTDSSAIPLGESAGAPWP